MAHNDNWTFFPPDRNLMGHSIMFAVAAWAWHGGAVYVPHQGYLALDIPDAGDGIYDMPPVEEVCLAHQTVACRQKKGCRGRRNHAIREIDAGDYKRQHEPD